MKYFLFSLFIFSLSASIAQINLRDDEGKKHGKWIVYLDNNWARTDDSTKASFKRMTVYDHGTNLYPMGPCGRKGWTLIGKTEKSGITRLEGEYKWIKKNGKISSSHVFNEGNYIDCKEYYSNGKVEQHFDYTKKFGTQENSWCLTIYDKEGNVKLLNYFCKQNGKWPKTRG
jgi:hypothetical protein